MSEIKSFAQDSAKTIWRERMVDFIRKYFSPKQLRNCRVLCLPGKEMREVFDVYDVLGIKRKSIVGLEKYQKEHRELEALNNSLEQRIQVHPEPTIALDYLTSQPVREFDIVSLDYCGYFNDETFLTLHKLALRGWLSPKAVLITNYQMAREKEDTKIGLRKSGTIWRNQDLITNSNFKKHRKFLLERRGELDQETRLGDLRDWVVQATPIAELFHGTGFWNTDFFKKWVAHLPEYNQENIRKVVEALNQGQNADQRDLLAKLIIDGEDPEKVHLMNYFINSQTRRFYCYDHQACKYVSDSRTPMISDFYLFEEEQNNLPANVRRSVWYKLNGLELELRIKDVKKVKQVLLASVEAHKKMFRINKLERELPLEREILGKKKKNHKKAVKVPHPTINDEVCSDTFLNSAFLESQKSATSSALKPKYCAFFVDNERYQPEKEPSFCEESKPEFNKENIYVALKNGTEDATILEQYQLTKMQLAGYKAAYTRIQKKEEREEDLELIREFLAEGNKPAEIADLFDNKYTIKDIASQLEI